MLPYHFGALSKPKKILIVRLSAIGDIVMALPVARALKEVYPNTDIHWLSQPECMSLVKDESCIGKTITWPRKQWAELFAEKRFITLWQAVSSFRAQLRQEHYDLVIDLQGLLKSGLLAWLSGATYKLGLGSREGSQYLMNQVVSRNLGDQDLIGSEYRTLIETVSGSRRYQLGLASAPENKLSAQKKLTQLNLSKGFIALCPFTTRPQKHWIDTHWRELVTELLAEQQYELLILGGPADSAYAARLFQGLAIHDLTGQTNLQEAANIIGASAAVIGVDTGLTHMGHAANVPTVAIFGSTRPYLNAEKPGSHIIYQARSCSPCKRNPTCDGRYDCMREINPSDVVEHLHQAIADHAK